MCVILIFKAWRQYRKIKKWQKDQKAMWKLEKAREGKCRGGTSEIQEGEGMGKITVTHDPNESYLKAYTNTTVNMDAVK